LRFLFDHDVPEDLQFLLRETGHSVTLLRDVLSIRTPDREVLWFAQERDLILISCNREDFLELAQETRHYGLILLFRRRTRATEKAALLRLIENAGDVGILGNINFA
jgi:predicted nuclease of predicted toxin-antitoxin system